MSKPISNYKFRIMVKSMAREEQRETIERHIRVLSRELVNENSRVDGLFNPKVVKHLENRLKLCRELWSEYLIENHVNKETV